MRWLPISMILAGLLFAASAEAQNPAPLPARAAFARGWLGISFQTQPAADGSLIIDEIAEGTPAERAGIQPGDRIVRWNDRTDVMEAIRSRTLAPGDTVRIRIAREGERDRDLSVVAEPRNMIVERRAGVDRDVIVVRPEELLRRFRLEQDGWAAHIDSITGEMRVLLRDSLGPMLERVQGQFPAARIEILRADSVLRATPGLGFALAGGRSAVAGAELADVTPGLGSYFGADFGALVIRVAPRTPAAEAGLQEGDVIVAAGGEEVRDVADLRRAVMPVPMGLRIDAPFGARTGPRPRIYVDGVAVDPAARRDIPLEIIRRGERYSVTLPR